MKLKLGGIAALLALGVFYTFAFCLVDDTDAEEISAEYYYTETEAEAPPEVTSASNPVRAAKHDYITETLTTTVTTAEPEAAAETEETTAHTEETTVAAAPPETEQTVPETIFEETETEEAETEYDDGAEAEERSLYGGYTIYDTEDIEDAETAVPETEAPETETSAETTAEETFVYDDYEDFIITFDNGIYPEETTVSVDYGGDISTSETFTVKFDGAVQTVNAYDLICWIVNNEMSESFSDEAIKAQAVASYSYVKYHNVNGQTPTVLVKKNPSERIKSLVSEVWGVCCYYNGSVAQTVYMASSSGYTADAVNVWGGSVPYLKSVYCPFDVDEDPNYGDTMKVSEDRMRTLLETALGITLSDNPYNWLTVTGYVDGNYVGALSVDGQKTITGRQMRETVMGHDLKSAAFDVYYSDGYFYFTTYGYGHGVGMSQNGANILAKRGYSYIDILDYYFTGIEIV